jgi:hypothetical protein
MIFCFVISILGCHKRIDDVTQNIDLRRIDSKDTSTIKEIKITQNGIVVDYCLLNENGVPATSFYEGENFKFHISITNNYFQDTSMYIITSFLSNRNLFMVFNNSTDTVGNPIKLVFMYKTGDYYNNIKKGEKWLIDIPWSDSQGSELPFNFNNLINFFQYYFIGLNRPFLPKGKYYTDFKQQFCFGRYLLDPQYICTDTLHIRINFEVK